MFLSTLIILITCEYITGDELRKYRNQYGDDYGSEWIYFPDGDDIPYFVNLTEPTSLSRSLPVNSIVYILYTKQHANIILDYLARPIEEKSQEFVEKSLSKKPIKIVTHGWRSSANKSAVTGIKDAYLKMYDDVAVIGVDWSSIANSIAYPAVALQTKTVGAEVAEFLDALNANYNVSGLNIHLIGHSLGAHVMGIAASKSILNVSRITGLDPARPLFEFIKESDKLDSTDAHFVDVIHTCGGVLGVKNSIGDADFYPNNGFPPQPGCGDIQHLLEACSHGRSHKYFMESIGKPNSFPACNTWTSYIQRQCGEYVFMGENLKRSARGDFFLHTNQEYPYGRGI